MPDTPNLRDHDASEAWSKAVWALREAHAELSALSKLARNHRDEGASELDDPSGWGLSLILNRTAHKVLKAARVVERAYLKAP